MIQALIGIDENTNRVLNIIKAKYDLNDKSEAIEFVVQEYIKQQNEPELRKEFIAKIKEIEKEKGTLVKDFADRYKTD